MSKTIEYIAYVGVIISGIYYLLYKFNVISLKFSSNYSVSKKYQKSIDELYNHVISTIQKSNFKIKDQNKDNYLIKAAASVTMKSFGEDIQITLKNIQKSETEICFFSICIFPTQIYDWGKNKKNATKFFSNLEDCLKVH